jgi:hypothetical protein
LSDTSAIFGLLLIGHCVSVESPVSDPSFHFPHLLKSLLRPRKHRSKNYKEYRRLDGKVKPPIKY